jgi:hypothetical protein
LEVTWWEALQDEFRGCFSRLMQVNVPARRLRLGDSLSTKTNSVLIMGLEETRASQFLAGSRPGRIRNTSRTSESSEKILNAVL